MPGNTRSTMPGNHSGDPDDPALVLEVTSKARGRTRYCKKCKFTCTDAREFTVHLVSHSESQSKQDSKFELSASSEKLQEPARVQGTRLQRSKHNSKTPSRPITTLIMEIPAEQLVDAPSTVIDSGRSAADHLDGTKTDLKVTAKEDERMQDEDDGDEPDAMMDVTDVKGHHGGISKLEIDHDVSGDEDMEDEGKLIIDDDGSLKSVGEKRVYTCNQCHVSMTSPKSYLRHLQEEHITKARIYECDKSDSSPVYRNKLLEHHQLQTKGDNLLGASRSLGHPLNRETEERDNFLNVSMRADGVVKNELEDMEEDNVESPNPGGLASSVPLTITTENIDQVLDDDKKKKKKTRQEVDPGKYFEAVDSSGTKYACSQCGNIYKWRKSLNKHWKEKHSLDPLVEVASPPGMLELLKSGKYTQLGARRIYDNIFLSTIKTQKDDGPQQQPSSPSSLAQSPSPPNFLNSSQPLVSKTPRLPTSLMPKMIGPFVASTAQPVFPGMALTIPHLQNGYDSPEESALDLTRDVKPDLQRSSPYSVTSGNDFNSSFDQDQPLDFSTKKDKPVKHDKLWDDLHDMKPSHSINQYIPKVHRCSKCEYTSTSEVEFANHTSSHLNKRIVKCNQCKMQINSMDELNNHFIKLHFKKLTEHKEAIKKIPHGLQQTYHLLKMDLQDIGELSNQDLGASEAKSLKCKKCEFEAKWPAELQKHAVSHSEERPYVCMVCGSTYKWKWDLVKHFQKSHPNLPNPYRRNDKRDTPDGSSDDEIDDEPDIKRQKIDSNNEMNGGIFGRDDIISIEGIMAATQAGQRVVSSQPNILDDEPQTEQNQSFFKSLPFGGNTEPSQAQALQMTAQEIIEHRNKAHKAIQDAVRGRQTSANVKKVVREQTSPITVVSKPEELPYKCTMCNYHARWPSEVTQHMKNHSDSKPYLCPRCEYRSKWKWDVVKHLKRCGGGGINDVIDTTKTRRREAMANNQGPPNAIVCQQGKVKKLTSQSPSPYLQSSADESGGQSGTAGGPTSSQNSALSSGDDLSRASSSASTLDLSSNSNNNDSGAIDNNANNNYTAYTNGQPFAGLSNASAPTTSNHSNSPSHSPPAPPTSTSSRQSSSGEVWNCPHCPFTTASQAELKRHSGLHSDDKPFKCDVCQYSTRWACDLKKHRKSYNHFPTQVNREEKEKAEKIQSHGRFKCSHCSLFFQSLQNLLEHRVAEHIGRDVQQPLQAPQEQNEIDAARIKHPRKPIKQLQCPKCAFVCKNRQTMEKHKEEHDQLDTSGFQCFYCSSQFKEKESLLDHMSTHPAFNPKEWETFFMISEEDDHHASKDEAKPGSNVDSAKKTQALGASFQQRPEPTPHRDLDNEEIVNSTEARIQQILNEVPKQVTKQSPQPSQQNANKFQCEWCPAEFVNLTAVYKHASQAHPIQLKEQDVSMNLSAGAKFTQQNSSKKSYTGEPIEILRQQIAEKRNQQLAEKLSEMITKNPKMQEVLSKKLEEGSKRYSCDKCSFSSANMATFQRHYDLHGSKLTSQCWFCDYSVDRMNLLYQHMKISHTRKWKALSQDPKYANQIHRMNQAFANVVVSGNNNDSPPDAAASVNGDLCAMDLSSKQKFTEVTHDIMYITKQQYTWSGIPVNVIPVGNALNFVCPHCAFKDASIAKTCAHVMQSHRAIAKFTCKKCQFSDDNIHVMSDHCKTTHPVHDRVVEVLDFKQLNFSELQMVQLAAFRERVHEDGSKTMSCPFCPYKTLVTENMKNHISNHSKQARYRCQICDFSSDSTSVISEHVKVHDLGYTIDNKRNAQVKEEKVNISNSESSKEEAETPALTSDRDGATKIKSIGRIRYRCLVCPFYTSCKSNILKHKRQHQHNKRYKCNKCSYSAARAVLLKKHLDAHDSQLEDDGLHHDIFYDPNDVSDDSKLDDADEMEEAEIDEDEFDDDETNSEELDEMDAKAIADLEAKDILEAEAAHKANAFPDDDPGTENGDKQFRKQKCPHCPFSSNSGYEFRKHLNFHGTQERYKCDYCSYSLDRLNLLSQHRKLHADELEYNPNPPAADLLNTQFIFQQNLSEKLQLEELSDKLDDDDVLVKQYPCQFCPYKTLKKKSFDIHQNSHGLRRRYVCDFCDWSADRLALLCQHRKVHEGEPSFDASPEDSVFLNHEFDDGATGEFEAKFMEVKTLDKPIKEGETDALLSPPFKLTVVKKIYPCQLCPYKTNSKSSYSVHTGMHGSDAEFNCINCSYAAPSRGLLQQHMHLHTTANADEPVSMTREGKITSEVESAKTFSEDSVSESVTKSDVTPSDTLPQPQLKCQRCPFTAVSQSLLKEHTLGHVTQDSIVCPYCDFSATSKQLMFPHIQVHFPGAKLDPDTLELNLMELAQVSLDGKTVNNNNQVESERKQHAIVKPYKVDDEAVKTKRVYVCQYCEREFEAKHLMIQHEKQHLLGSH
ncbi:unnamed protein product [Lymnaea stagnalis]|uniref:C2H2-type domain-containing protein n=1 Tax=Lymnaea stagnalis TaxID=6523 RepID=A0AAV2HQW8_LYMST